VTLGCEHSATALDMAARRGKGAGRGKYESSEEVRSSEVGLSGDTSGEDAESQGRLGSGGLGER
jgi:hypothetical protein